MVVAIALFVSNKANGSEKDLHTYVTGVVMEIDRCASAWLIKRYIDTRAEFRLLTDEELMTTEGIQFDTPFAELRRTHRFSTFEAIKHKFSVDNNFVEHIASLIHEIEINFWAKKANKKAAKFEYELKQIIDKATDNKAALAGCFSYLDGLAITTQ